MVIVAKKYDRIFVNQVTRCLQDLFIETALEISFNKKEIVILPVIFKRN